MTSLRSSPPPLLPPAISTKKRQRPDIVNDFPSSDPVFSSDDFQDASVDQYDAPRKKKQFRGSWWQSSQEAGSLAEPPFSSQKASLVRNFDSGVWMGSDDSIASSSSFPSLPDNPSLSNAFDQFLSPSTEPEKKEGSPHTRAELTAQEIVEKCLDKGNEYIDLSDIGLQKLDGVIIRPLKTFSSAPAILDRDFRPRLKIMLSRNSLRSVPKELWELDHVTHLGLRQNQLMSLPPKVANLMELQSLDVTGNRIRWLPWELLCRIHPRGPLKEIHLEHGNDLVMPLEDLSSSERVSRRAEEAQKDQEDSHHSTTSRSEMDEMERWLLKVNKTFTWEYKSSRGDGQACKYLAPWLVGVTKMSRFDLDGSLSRDSPEAPSLTSLEQQSIRAYLLEDLPKARPVTSSRAHSLFEIALRKTASLVSTEQLRTYLPDMASGPIEHALTELEHTQAEGGRTCSVCGHEYVIPRAEWIEFWHLGNLSHDMDDTFLPFLRRACSWRCGDDAFAHME